MPTTFRMKRGGKLHQAYELVKEIPSTAEEVGAEMDITTSAACSLLDDLRSRGIVTSGPFGNSGGMLWRAASGIVVQLVAWDGKQRERDKQARVIEMSAQLFRAASYQMDMFNDLR